MAGRLRDKLMELPEGGAVAIRMGADQYFDAIRDILDVFAPQKDLDVLYVTSTIPSRSIINALEVLEIPMDHIWFVDCISQIMMSGSGSEKHAHSIHVESPTMLENIMLKVEYLIRKTKERGNVIVLDSINSLAIHNNTKILSEFLHILVSNLRSKNCYTIVFSMEQYETDEIRNMLNLVCDETIIVEGAGGS
jgi:KaiC/GvpD/RAD55 family RecA-like ATPase